MALILPTNHRAGDSFEFTASIDEYPASVWTLTIKLVNSDKFYTLTGVADGEDHSVTADYATTATWLAGTYTAVAQVSDGTLKHTLATSRFAISPDLTVATDVRHHAEKMLDAIEAYLENRATDNQLDILNSGFGQRSLQRMSAAELLVIRDRYKRELDQIKKADAIQNGLGSKKQIYTRLKV